MLSFRQIDKRLGLLLADMDGDLWTSILAELNPPDGRPRSEMVHDLCFRDAKALAGYIPDLRAVMGRVSPQSLDFDELAAFKSIRGLLNFAARIPILILYHPDYTDNQNLISFYNGFRQTLKEVDEYLALAAPPEKGAN
ncbi:MAG: hypothetical protein LBJ64_00405 [Deltaproteobacteria bacterium]|jgi:hypothetical protein|nr:hypothetical protein [Deltaproteobacteria bacterium]